MDIKPPMDVTTPSMPPHPVTLYLTHREFLELQQAAREHIGATGWCQRSKEFQDVCTAIGAITVTFEPATGQWQITRERWASRAER